MNKKIIKLEETGKENPFKVPEGYFDNFTARIMNQLPEKATEEPKVISFWERAKPWMYMAAMFAGIALMVKLFTISSKPTNGHENSKLNLTSSADIEAFYQYYEDQLANKTYQDTFYLDGADISDDFE
jgi:hypothetical protein